MASFLIWPLVGSAVLLPLVQLENHQVKLPDKCNDFAAGTKFINLGAMFPMNGSWDGGVVCYPAAQLALAHLNCHPSRSLVDGYKLKLQVTDTYCEPGKGVKDLYDFLYESSPLTPSAILGPGCSPVSTAVAEAAHLWNVLMVSYGSSSPALSDRTRFPTFFRTHPSALIHNPTRINLFSQFNWKKVFLLVHLQEVFTTTAHDLTQLAKKNGITVKRSTFQADPKNAIESLKVRYIASYNKVDTSKQIIFVPKFVSNLYSIYANAAKKNGITVKRSTSQADPKNAIESLKAQDARIIVGLFYETAARQAFCEAYKAGLYGPRVVWFILGWFPDNWFHPHKNEKLSCSLEQMRAATDGHFTTEIMQLGSEESATFAGIKPSDFQKTLLSKLGTTGKNSGGFPESPLAYDAVWALAIAINETIIELKRQRKNVENELKAVRDVTVISKEAFTLMKRNLDRTNFIGVSGNVSFFAGDRLSSVAIEFMRNGSYYEYGSHTENYDVNVVENELDFWPFDEKAPIPRDQIEVYSKLDRLRRPVFFTVSVFAFIGILCSLALLLFNSCLFKHANVIYNSQPVINSVMLVGCALTLFCVFLNGLTDELDPFLRSNDLCQVLLWMMSLGFTLGFGSLFAKVWALHVVAVKMKPSRMKALAASSRSKTSTSPNGAGSLMSPVLQKSPRGKARNSSNNVHKKGEVLSEKLDDVSLHSSAGGSLSSDVKDVEMNSMHMYSCLIVLILLDIGFLCFYSNLAPLSLQKEFLPIRNVTADGEVRVRPYIRHCRSSDHNLWTGLNFGFKGMLLLVGALFAYESRNVEQENMNDSRQVAMSVYNIVTLYWITVPVTMLIKAHQDASYIFSSLATILSVFVTQGFIFGPKIRAIVESNLGGGTVEDLKEPSMRRLASSKSSSSTHSQLKRESTKRRRAAMNKKRANEVEQYNQLNEENERIKREIIEAISSHSSSDTNCISVTPIRYDALDDYLERLRNKYEELSREKLEGTLRKRAPPGRVPVEDIDFFTEFLYIDQEDMDQMSVTEL